MTKVKQSHYSHIRTQKRQRAYIGEFAKTKAGFPEVKREYKAEAIRTTATLDQIKAGQKKTKLSQPEVIKKELLACLAAADRSDILTWAARWDGVGGKKAADLQLNLASRGRWPDAAVRAVELKRLRAELRRWGCPVNTFTLLVGVNDSPAMAFVLASRAERHTVTLAESTTEKAVIIGSHSGLHSIKIRGEDSPVCLLHPFCRDNDPEERRIRKSEKSTPKAKGWPIDPSKD